MRLASISAVDMAAEGGEAGQGELSFLGEVSEPVLPLHGFDILQGKGAEEGHVQEKINTYPSSAKSPLGW